MRKLLVPLSLTLASLVLIVGCGQEKAIASVDGESIPLADFNEYLTTKRTVRVVVQGQIVEVPVAETLGFQALQELTTQKVILHMAADAGIAPTEQEVDKEIDFKKAINPRFMTDLKNSGMSLGQIRREVAYALAEERLLTRGITVGMDEVEKMLKEKPEQFTEPAYADVYQIYVLSQARKDLVDKELQASQSFKSVATKYNQSPDGSHKRLQISKLTGPTKSVITDSPVGGTTNWVAVSGGFIRFYIESRTEAKPIEMTADKREYIRRQIAITYGKQANDLAKQVAEKLRSTDVKVSDDEVILKDMWKRFEDRLEKTSPTTGQVAK